MDRLKRGPICKHAGAVLLALSGGQCDAGAPQEARQRSSRSASDRISSPSLRAELQEPVLEARSAVGRGACEHPAARAAGVAEGAPVASGER
eukprot:2879179-Alexandrium_andersonii.AAC.1